MPSPKDPPGPRQMPRPTAPTPPLPLRVVSPPLAEGHAPVRTVRAQMGDYTLFDPPLHERYQLHLARHSSGQEVVVKILAPDQTFAPGLSRRFAEESQNISGFVHPQVIRLAGLEPVPDSENMLLVLGFVGYTTYAQASTVEHCLEAMMDTVDRFLEIERFIGTVIHNYEIKTLRGMGANGMVYMAEHTQISGSRVAIKIIGDDDSKKFERIRLRVDREAATVGHLTHPNIMRLNNYQIFEDTRRIALLFEYVDGQTLAELASDSKFRENKKQVLEIMRQSLDGLRAAHEWVDPTTGKKQPIIHRDIKPSNIMVSDSGERPWARILDFGIAKITRSQESEESPSASPASPSLTETHALLGTPYYMAPEYVLTKQLTPLSDLYAIGVTLFKVLTGKEPFSTPQRALQAALTGEKPPTLRQAGAEVSDALESFCQCLMDPDPAKRYQSAQEAIAALEHLPEYTGKHSSAPQLEIVPVDPPSPALSVPPPSPVVSAPPHFSPHPSSSVSPSSAEHAIPLTRVVAPGSPPWALGGLPDVPNPPDSAEPISLSPRRPEPSPSFRSTPAPAPLPRQPHTPPREDARKSPSRLRRAGGRAVRTVFKVALLGGLAIGGVALSRSDLPRRAWNSANGLVDRLGNKFNALADEYLPSLSENPAAPPPPLPPPSQSPRPKPRAPIKKERPASPPVAADSAPAPVVAPLPAVHPDAGVVNAEQQGDQEAESQTLELKKEARRAVGKAEKAVEDAAAAQDVTLARRALEAAQMAQREGRYEDAKAAAQQAVELAESAPPLETENTSPPSAQPDAGSSLE